MFFFVVANVAMTGVWKKSLCFLGSFSEKEVFKLYLFYREFKNKIDLQPPSNF
jgi:hypothetical protein